MKVVSAATWCRWLITLMCLAASGVADFTWTELPTEMTIGQTYEIAWTGAAGAVEIYAKKDASPSSWRAHVYGGGNDNSYNWTVIDLLEPERTYIFSAYDYGTEEIYNSAPIFVHAAPTASVRGRWVARQF